MLDMLTLQLLLFPVSSQSARQGKWRLEEGKELLVKVRGRGTCMVGSESFVARLVCLSVCLSACLCVLVGEIYCAYEGSHVARARISFPEGTGRLVRTGARGGCSGHLC